MKSFFNLKLHKIALIAIVVQLAGCGPQKREARDFDAHLSANRMCEIGMDRATGRSYYSALLELERATRRL